MSIMAAEITGMPASMPEPSNADTAVRLDGVTKQFGNAIALRDAWIKVRRGEFMTLLGPSGCGKTTLLNLVAGFLIADRGEILIEGALVTDVPTSERDIGMIFQNYALFPHMTVAANIAYGLKTRGIAREEIATRVAGMLSLMKLTGLEQRKPRELSGGQQQRVALARALVIRPKVLLMDEPFSALDKNLRASMQVEVKEIQRRLGVTTIFVTHDQSEALSLSDRIAVMSEGRIRQIDTPQRIYQQPADRFVASFIGEVAVLRGRLESIDGEAAIVVAGACRNTVAAAPLRALSPGAAVDLFVRPEHLRLVTENEPAAARGTVATHVYQGGHIDVYVDAAEAASGRVLVRVPGDAALGRAPVGARVGVATSGVSAVAFPPED
jgi:putative spermidine/putrescine transport system ATP-binding protein/spermidine/putrescine transport system ATP-binding protein